MNMSLQVEWIKANRINPHGYGKTQYLNEAICDTVKLNPANPANSYSSTYFSTSNQYPNPDCTGLYCVQRSYRQ